MKENQAIALRLCASLLSWVSFGLGIIAVVVSHWYYFETNTSVGLWELCFNGVCTPVPVDSSLQATRSFIILMLLFNLIGSFTSLLALCDEKKKLGDSTGTIWFIAAIFGLFGAAIYTAALSARLPSTLYRYGYAFILAWICSALLFIANVLNYFSASPTDESDKQTNKRCFFCNCVVQCP